MFKKKTDKINKPKKKAYVSSTPEKATEEKAKNTEPKEAKGFIRAVPVILCAIALFVTLCFITGETGAFGEFISSALKGLFSYMAYTIPAFIILHAVYFIYDIENNKLIPRILISFVFLITLSELAYIIPNFSVESTFDTAKFYNDGIQSIGGGFIGGLFGYAIQKIVGKAGLIIVIALTVFLCGLYYIAGKSEQIYAGFIKRMADIANKFAKAETARNERKKRAAEAKQEKKQAVDTRKNIDFLNDDFFDTKNGVSELHIPELGIKEVKDNAKGEAAFNLKETVTEPAAKTETKSDKKIHRVVSEYDVPLTDKFEKSDEKKDGYRPDDIVYEIKDEPAEENNDPFADVSFSFGGSTEENHTSKSYSYNDSAESVFSGSFDPYDIAVNESLARKKSSKAEEKYSADTSYSEDISEITPEQVEKMRRLAEFEARRQEALQRKAAREAEAAAMKFTSDSLATSEEKIASASDSLATSEEKMTSVSDDSPTHSYFTPSEAGVESVKPENTTTYSAQSNSSYRYTTIAEVANAYEDIKPPVATPKPTSNGAFRFVGETAKEAEEPAKSTPVFSVPKQEKVFAEADTTSNEETYTVPEIREKNDDYNISAGRNNFVFEAEDYKEPSATVSEETVSTISVNRSPIEAEISMPSGLDFSFEEDEDEIEVGEPEEIVERTEIPPEERNEKLYEYRNMFSIFSSTNEKETAASPADEAVDSRDTETPNFSATDNSEKNFAENASPELNNDSEDSFEESTVTDILADNSDNNSDNEDFSEQNTITVDDSAADEIYNTDVKENGFTKTADDAEDFEDEDDVPFDVDEEDEEEEFIQQKERPDYSDYKFPPIDFLKRGAVEDVDGINEEIQVSGDKLISTLDSFNIKATIRGIERGPRITRYSIVPARGVRVNQIEKRSDDIALALAAESIRIEAPIPGKAAVGVEVPNKISSIVSIRDLIESEEFNNDKSSTIVAIGKSIEGSNVFGNISSMPHLLIAGATGMGKSVCINSLITSILYKARPDEVKFIMIDPKKVEFAPYDGIPHLLVPVVTEVKHAAGVLMWAVDEMNKRYDVIQHAGVRGIDAYNEKIKLHPELGQFMSKIVIFIDELNDLMITVRDPVEGLITLIAQKARAAGIHLVIGTQRPSVNVITGVIKANIPSRIACKVSSGIDSRTILEQIGAEKLIGKGDMLFSPGGKPNPIRVQGAFVSDQETENIVNFIKAQAKGEVYDTEVMEDIRRAAQKCDKNKNGNDNDDDYDDDGAEGVGYLRDKKFLTAVEHAIKRGSIATSYLQRKLRIGYAKAAQYIDIMEDLGIVGEKDGSKPRDVLISMSEWMEKLSRLTDDD